MTDCFALLQEPRRPWLDPEELKQKFHSLSSKCHPDKFHTASTAEQKVAQQEYAELNRAYQRLREPKERLQHLLELESGTKPGQVQSIPPGLMEISLQVAQLCREADGVAAEKSQTSSPLLQVQLFERAQDCTEKLMGLQRQLKTRQEELLMRLRELDAEWEKSCVEGTSISPTRAALLVRLQELANLLGYFGRWTSQLQERIVQLSF